MTDVNAGGGCGMASSESVKGGKTAVIVVACVVASFLTVVIGVVGSLAISRTMDVSYEMYDMHTLPVQELGMAVDMLQRQRTAMGEIILGVAIDDFLLVEDAFNRSNYYRMAMFENMDRYYVTIRNPEELMIFNEALMLYENEFLSCFDRVYSLATEGADPDYIYDVLRENIPVINVIIDNLGWCMDLRLGIAADSMHFAEDTGNSLLIVIVCLTVLAILVLCFTIFRAAPCSLEVLRRRTRIRRI